MRSEVKPATAVVIIVLVVAIVAAFLWRRTSSTRINPKSTLGNALQSLTTDAKKREMVRKRWYELQGKVAPPAPAGQTGQ